MSGFRVTNCLGAHRCLGVIGRWTPTQETNSSRTASGWIRPSVSRDIRLLLRKMTLSQRTKVHTVCALCHDVFRCCELLIVARPENPAARSQVTVNERLQAEKNHNRFRRATSGLNVERKLPPRNNPNYSNPYLGLKLCQVKHRAISDLHGAQIHTQQSTCSCSAFN